ncbi:NAD(P)H-dependent oxidoreductase [Sphingomonas sp. 7/4-4]|uniref:FMN-dependent NADH-azoreductase n=1 Tax=Sphingomonas sp. 7/4-4 TaxID=3018446 RepID=UPI0022F3C4E0|nr:NAD(P)H-dependent oxidoreductase [Sphingomonas sp. 7/4-4]WBY08977.1 NAD(P)H-dependent oxidoreductase [Sphingomonas sp. 7/4-4]
MARNLLHIEASPRGVASVSTVLAEYFVDRLRDAEPALRVDRLRLWEEPLPDLDGALLSAKYAVLAGRDLDSGEARSWEKVRGLVERVRAADSLVLSTPMWNFGIPYKLKHWIDLITQPGLSFAFDPQTGYRPLLSSRPFTIVLASAGDYSEGPSWGRPDLASGYLREAFRFIGLGDPEIVRAGATAGDPGLRERSVTAARATLDARVGAHRTAS